MFHPHDYTGRQTEQDPKTDRATQKSRTKPHHPNTVPAEQGKEGGVGTVALLNGLHVTLGAVRVLDIGELHAVDGLRGQPGIDSPDLLHVIARVLRQVADQGAVVARDRLRGLQNIL